MVKDYSFKEYELDFIKGEHWDTHPEKNFFIGFELEVEFPNLDEDEMHDIADYIETTYKEILCCKWDGSLYNGFEFISHPIHVELYENGYMETMLSKLSTEISKYGGVVGASTGLHFHVSRRAFSRNGFSRRLLCLMTNFREELMKHSGRYDYNLVGDMGRTRFNYCQFPELTLSNINTSELIITRGHRTALNCANDDTIEFRFFAATLDVKEFFKRVSIVINLVRTGDKESAHNISIKDIIPWYDGKEKFSVDLAQVSIIPTEIPKVINRFIAESNNMIKDLSIYTMREFLDNPDMVKQLFGHYDYSEYYNPRIKNVNGVYRVKNFNLSLFDYTSHIVDTIENYKSSVCCNDIHTLEEQITKLDNIIEQIKTLEKVKVDIWEMIR